MDADTDSDGDGADVSAVVVVGTVGGADVSPDVCDVATDVGETITDVCDIGDDESDVEVTANIWGSTYSERNACGLLHEKCIKIRRFP